MKKVDLLPYETACGTGMQHVSHNNGGSHNHPIIILPPKPWIHQAQKTRLHSVLTMYLKTGSLQNFAMELWV